MIQTDELKLLPLIEVSGPEEARCQLPQAEEKLRMSAAAREQQAIAYERCQEVQREDQLSARYLHARIAELTAATREKRAECEREIIAMREACHAESLAQELRRDEDTLALYTSAYEDLIERQQGLHGLDTWEALASLNRARESEADAMAMVSHLRSVIALEPVFKEEGRCGFVGQRTQELVAAAREAHRVAGVTEQDLREARANYEKQQAARINRGIITASSVRHAIGR